MGDAAPTTSAEIAPRDKRRKDALAFAHECLREDARNEWPGTRGAWVAAHTIYLLTGRNVRHTELVWANGKQVRRPIKWNGKERRWEADRG